MYLSFAEAALGGMALENWPDMARFSLVPLRNRLEGNCNTLHVSVLFYPVAFLDAVHCFFFFGRWIEE